MESNNEEETMELEAPATEEATQQEVAQQQEEAPAAPAMWYDELPEGIRDNPNVTKHKSVESISKAYIESVRKLGEKGNMPLPDDATPEQRAAYNSIRRGNVKSPSDYSFEQGSQDVDVINFKQALYNAGADNYMANEIYNVVNAQWKQDEAVENAKAEEICKNELEKLRSEWQENYQVNMKANELMLANRYQDAQKILAATGADRFACVQMMLRDLNARAGDAQIRFDEAKHETTNDQIKRIQNSAAYKNEFNPKHKEARLKLGEFFVRQAGEYNLND